ncbi:hypothetical protein Bca101_029389 [Brassica carinata]
MLFLAANCLRDMECQEAILRREGECKCGQEASPEMAIHHNLSRKIGIMIRRNKVMMR